MTDWTPPESDEAVSNSWSAPASDTIVKQPSRISKLAAPPAKPSTFAEKLKNAFIVPENEREKPTQGLVQGLEKSFADIPAEMTKQSKESLNTLKDSVTRPISGVLDYTKRPFEVAADALGYVMSPITGALTSVAGRPVEKATGIRREITGNALSALVPVGGEADAAAQSAKISKVANTANKAAQSVADLKAAARQAYSVSDKSGMRMTPLAIDNLKASIDSDLMAKGFHPKLMPRTQVALDEIGKVAEAKQGATLQDMDVLRKITGHAASAPDKAERFMGRVVQDHIDNFVENLNTTHISGPVDAKAINAISDARDLWTKASKGEIIENAIAKAKLNAHNFSASGYENSLRTQFRKIANNDRAMARFAPEERDAIINVAKGGKVENGLRMLGKFAPHGVVSTALGAGTGFAAGGPAGAVALPVIGEIARQAATALTARNAARASELVRGGDPAGITLLKNFGQIMPKTRAILTKNSLPMLRRAPAINALKQLTYQSQQQ